MRAVVQVVETLTAIGLLILVVRYPTVPEKIITYIQKTVTGAINLGQPK